MPMITIFTLMATAAIAEPPTTDVCSSPYRHLFSIDGRGKFIPTAAAKSGWDIMKSPRHIKLRAHGFNRERYRVITIDLDESGLPIAFQETNPGLANQLWPLLTSNVITPADKTRTQLDYSNGTCLIRKVTSGSRTLVDTKMCNELKALYASQQQCRERCDAGHSERISKVILDNGGDFEDAPKVLGAGGFPGGKVEAQAFTYLQRCSHPVMMRSMAVLSSKAEAAPTDPKSNTPVTQ